MVISQLGTRYGKRRRVRKLPRKLKKSLKRHLHSALTVAYRDFEIDAVQALRRCS